MFRNFLLEIGIYVVRLREAFAGGEVSNKTTLDRQKSGEKDFRQTIAKQNHATLQQNSEKRNGKQKENQERKQRYQI